VYTLQVVLVGQVRAALQLQRLLEQKEAGSAQLFRS